MLWYSPNRTLNYPALNESNYGFTLILDSVLLIAGDSFHKVRGVGCSYCLFAGQLWHQVRCAYHVYSLCVHAQDVWSV